MSGAARTAQNWLEIAARLHHAGRFADAILAYRQAVASDASLFEAWHGLGFAAATAGEHADAITAFRTAMALNPAAAALRINLGELLFALGLVSEAIGEYERAASDGDEETRRMAWLNIACVAPGDPAMDNQAIAHVRRRWADSVPAQRRITNWRPGEKMKIGYLSSFFGERNWMKMFIGVINAHDRDHFEVHLIADRTLPSAEAGYRDHADDRIWDVDGVSNEDLAGHILDARIDVLVDLNGYSDLARLPVLSHHPAPLQISWGNMYATSGLAALDFVVGDRWTIPPEEEAFCVEPVRRVPNTYMAFDMFYPTPEVAPPPFLTSGHVTFGSLMSGYKITDPVIASWSRVLLGVPNARLLLRNCTLDAASNRANVLARFAACGIDADRLSLEGGGAHFDFLRMYGRIDIALDAFPYNGGTSTAEALWQGVPLLTFNGDRWASRTSRSILMAAGLSEFVAEDQAGFEAMAIRMAREPGGLAAVRAGLRARIMASPACDTAGLCRALEAIYREEARGHVP